MHGQCSAQLLYHGGWPQSTRLWWVIKAQELVPRCVDYFNAKLIGKLGPVLDIFKDSIFTTPVYANLLL